jgi:hypothetical protein
MSDERSVEEHLRQLRNQISHLNEHEMATLENKIPRLLRELEERNAKTRQLISEVLKLAATPPRSPAPPPAVPPTWACFLLDLFLSKADRKAIPGDLEEEFRARLAQYGPTRARLWFWGETVRTIATRNPICRSVLVGGLMRLGEWIFRQIGS